MSTNKNINEESVTTTKEAGGVQKQQITRPKRFLVHFRRPLLASYDGSYGFDWLRDEYVYDIERVLEKADVKTKLYKGKKIDSLIKEYTQLNKNDLPKIKEIVPLDKETYIPAWLAIFPTSNPIHASGVDLHLQLDQESPDGSKPNPLEDDGTILVFETSTGIVVTPSQISLGKLITKDRKERVLNSSVTGLSSKTVQYYKDESVTINIKATGHYSEAGYVKVIAKREGKTRNVGLLMMYPNSSIPKADIRVIELCTVPKQNSIPTPTNYKSLIETKSFNQALIKSKISQAGVLNIAEISNDYSNKAKTSTLSTIEHIKKQAIDKFIKTYKPQSTILDTFADLFLEDIIKLFETLRADDTPDWERDNIGWIDSDKHNTSFVIFTDYAFSDGSFDTAGIATAREELLDPSCLDEQCYSMVWGNAVVLFDAGNTNLITFFHELGHSFSLPHTFEEEYSTKHNFYQGYTDNLMDYDYRLNPNNVISASTDNPYNISMWSLFKWQWDILRQDKSLDYSGTQKLT